MEVHIQRERNVWFPLEVSYKKKKPIWPADWEKEDEEGGRERKVARVTVGLRIAGAGGARAYRKRKRATFCIGIVTGSGSGIGGRVWIS
jgi:hypothetical protein